jgi:hypothetical protein
MAVEGQFVLDDNCQWQPKAKSSWMTTANGSQDPRRLFIRLPMAAAIRSAFYSNIHFSG